MTVVCIGMKCTLLEMESTTVMMALCLEDSGSSTTKLTLSVRATGYKTPGESSEIRMRLLEGYSILYTSSNVRVSRIGAKLVCLSITSKQAKVAPEGCHAVQG